jgi:D-alanyl-D-alanine carboxypeptidase/D-alanyl-D-alanine-endopeptidase (penicillin-binding protein 4)
MSKVFFTLLLLLLMPCIYPQEKSLARLLSDSTMKWAGVSFLIRDLSTGEKIISADEEKPLSQASVLKLVTTAAAIEKLGPDYRFSTILGYRGTVRNGILKGDIIIKGGGDPSLASPDFAENYGNLLEEWANAIKERGIKRVKGNIIADDTRYDNQPVPADWNWGDLGNYYGAGIYGLSLFDNTLKLHFATGDTGSTPVLTSTDPLIPGLILENRLRAYGSGDNGYVYLAPYSLNGWIEGTIPAGEEDFVLKASIPDPPHLAASLLRDMLIKSGIGVSGNAAASRTVEGDCSEGLIEIKTVYSPPLSDLIKVLNHKSVNLYAEHLVKELGYIKTGVGKFENGIEAIYEFLDSAGVDTGGLFILDGSGLSPQNALSAKGLTDLLAAMKRSKNYTYFFNSLPEAGQTGTLKNYFKDPVFSGNLRAKSGSMSRVRSYAGYFKTLSGREMVFAVIVNNYTGSSRQLISSIEDILAECIREK